MSAADVVRLPPAQAQRAPMEWRGLMLAPIVVESLHAAGIDLGMAGGSEGPWPRDAVTPDD